MLRAAEGIACPTLGRAPRAATRALLVMPLGTCRRPHRPPTLRLTTFRLCAEIDHLRPNEPLSGVGVINEGGHFHAPPDRGCCKAVAWASHQPAGHDGATAHQPSGCGSEFLRQG